MSQKLKYKDLNLLDVYHTPKYNTSHTSLLKFSIFPLSAFLILAGLFGVQTYRAHDLKAKTANVNEETQQLINTQAEDPNLEKYSKYLESAAQLLKFDAIKGFIESYPQLSQSTFDDILIAADLNVEVLSFAYDRNTQVITLKVESMYANDTENFVRKLKTTGTFSAVDYSGYTLEEKTTTDEQTNEKTTSDKTDTKDSTEALLEQLLNITTNQNKTVTKTTSRTYAATVLCVLK